MIFAIACYLGYWSHFKVKFPIELNKTVLAVVLYGFLMGVHYLIENFLEKQAFYVGCAHTIKGLKDYQQVYFFSEMDEKPTEINYKLTLTGYSASGRMVESKVSCDCTKLFDTHGYLHLKKVHENLTNPGFSKLALGAKTA